jgi:hypothetical protein
MALQAHDVHLTQFEEPRIGGPVGCVAAAAALGFDRYVFVDEWSLLIDVALVTNGVAACERTQLPDRPRAVRIVTVAALH